MVEFLSSWAEQIIIAVIVASIIEMILPDNKNKKYIKMVIGIYILFNILSPIVDSNDNFFVDDLKLESYAVTDEKKTEVNQASMDERLQDLYVEELEKSVQETVKEQGYEIKNCKIEAKFYGNEENQGINKIKLVVSKSDSAEENNNSDIQSVDKVKINVGLSKYLEDSTDDESNNSQDSDIQNLKKVICQTYEIDSSKVDISIK